MEQLETKMIITILILIIIILIAIWNGLVIEWKLTGKYSSLWHITGLVTRLLLISIVYIVSGLWWSLGAVMLSWIPYNIIISLIVWNKWWYLSDSGIDKIFKNILQWIKLKFYK